MTWALSEPEETNPNFGPERFCSRNQPKDVWFLAATGRRTCTIPAGRPIVFPAIYFITGDSKDACQTFMATVDGRVILDGREVTYGREDNDYVTYTSVKDNPLDGFAGKAQTYLCGLWVYLPPPSTGEHTLSVRGSDSFISMSAEWTLIVK
ncbi:signal protein [Nonomuraea angiospora]|uniref:signal protein n=1 Tax=Nonomuraea angiospora TaxID=46172 RepID=UPI00341477F6